MFYQTEIVLEGVRPGRCSAFPALRPPIRSEVEAELSDRDGLFVNYGHLTGWLPFSMQDDYDAAAPSALKYQALVLENEYLKAEIVPELGGRLWSLYDKAKKRDVLLRNTELKLGNLALRNAWFAGGVEWNVSRGHDERTCLPRFVGLIDWNGTPVVRIYEFNRDRMTPFQLDVFLPEGSKCLFVRGRIVNLSKDVVPMYYWTNMALPEGPRARVVVPTCRTYANFYSQGNHFLRAMELPSGEGFDGSFPENFPVIRDYFYDLPERQRKYECVFYEDGYGFAHASTRRLQGRKLFVWGMSNGGRHWQEKLLGAGAPPYIELQAGLAKTQQECLPMPPLTAWEWLEVMGPVEAAPERIYGEWNGAVEHASELVEKMISEQRLDDLLEAGRAMATGMKGEVLQQGSGWGALEELRRGAAFSSALDFGKPGAEQLDWLELLNTGAMNDDGPVRSWMIQTEWFELLKRAKPSWKVCYHRALCLFAAREFERAEREIRDSINFQRNAWNLHALANILRELERPADEWLPLLREAVALKRDGYLVKETMKLHVVYKHYAEALEFYASLPAPLRRRPMLKFLYADALAHTGEIEKAESIIMRDGGLEIPDLREGETSISELYLYIQRQKHRTGDISVPYRLDIRLN